MVSDERVRFLGDDRVIQPLSQTDLIEVNKMARELIAARAVVECMRGMVLCDDDNFRVVIGDGRDALKAYDRAVAGDG